MPKSVQQILISPTISGTGEHRNWVSEASNEQLDEYISLTTGNEILHRIALAEREKRYFNRLSERHWTLTWGFIVAVLAMVFAAIAAWPVIRDWIPNSSRANKDSNSQPPQPHSELTMPQPEKTLPATNVLKQKSVLSDTNLLKK